MVNYNIEIASTTVYVERDDPIRRSYSVLTDSKAARKAINSWETNGWRKLYTLGVF